MVKQVVKVHITEYERGWGSRPDGALYFKTLQDAQAFLAEEMRKREGAVETPACYESYGQPVPAEMSDADYEEAFKGREQFWKR